MDLLRLSRRLSSSTLQKNYPLLQIRRQNTQTRSSPRDKKIEEANPEIKITKETIEKLERLALVNFGNDAGIERLKAAVNFVECLRNFHVDESVEPLYTVLENEKLRLRDDCVTEGNCRDKILKNAAVLEEEYFVAPLGNISRKQ